MVVGLKNGDTIKIKLKRNNFYNINLKNMEKQSALIELSNSINTKSVIEIISETIEEVSTTPKMSVEVKLFEVKDQTNIYEIISHDGPKAFVYAGITIGAILNIHDTKQHDADTTAIG